MKAALIGHLPHHWLLNNRLYSLPGRKQQAHQGSGFPLCSDFMAFYATIRNTVYSVGAHCARLGGCGLLGKAGALPPGEERFCDRLGDNIRGARHCYWGNWLPRVEAALAPGARLSPTGQEEGRRRMEFLIEEQPRSPGKLCIRALLTQPHPASRLWAR